MITGATNNGQASEYGILYQFCVGNSDIGLRSFNLRKFCHWIDCSDCCISFFALSCLTLRTDEFGVIFLLCGGCAKIFMLNNGVGRVRKGCWEKGLS